MATLLLYIDPGTGSIFFQAILSVFATFLLFFNRFKSLFVRVYSKLKQLLGAS